MVKEAAPGVLARRMAVKFRLGPCITALMRRVTCCWPTLSRPEEVRCLVRLVKDVGKLVVLSDGGE